MTGTAAFGAIVTALVVIVWQRARAAMDSWRHARGVIEVTAAGYPASPREKLSGQPVPFQLTAAAEDMLLLAALCRACRGGGGDCMCPAQCGELSCMGGFSDSDVAFLRGLSMPEGGGQ